MNQSRGLEGLPGLLLGEFLRRQFPQLIIDKWQELLGGVRIALLDGGQDAGNLIHRRHPDVRNTQRNVLARVREHGSESLAR